MNSQLSSEIDAWLLSGGLLVTASERAARSISAGFNRSRRAEGLTAWLTPNIQDFQTFVRTAWEQRCTDDRLVLNSLQEHSLWAGIVAAAAPEAARLAGARDRLASLAMEAHGLICAYAPHFLNRKSRAGWDRDAAAFSSWLTSFDDICRTGKIMSAARLSPELVRALQEEKSTRPPLLLAGFDRILPVQQELFAAWGNCTQISLDETADRIEFHQAPDSTSELAACAIWCKHQLAVAPHARLLVVTQDVAKRRGEIERAFLRFACEVKSRPAASTIFEFSLGVSLGQVAPARGANLLLHWLTESIEEHDLDWLFSSGQLAASHDESLSLTAYMRALRLRDLQRTRWTLAEFLRQRPGAELPAAWIARVTQAQRKLQESVRRPQSPLTWAELATQLLELAGWPGGRTLASGEFQAHRRWLQVVDDCASLGFDGRRISWTDFLTTLDRASNQTLFAPESQDAPILIAGPAESAGLAADAVWFLGANEEAWPPRGSTHPLIPLFIQREFGMPHATVRLDWDLAVATTRRLLASAPEVHFSYARQSEDAEARSSRLVVQIAGQPHPLPIEFNPPQLPHPATISFDDASQIPFPAVAVRGGSAVLSSQSQCPFKAFAIARLAAESWEPAEAGLTAKERGQLLHEVLHAVWAGPPNGISSHSDLAALANLPEFVAGHVNRALQSCMPARARDCMPPRYLALEETRLISLVTEWLEFERTRIPFTVLHTELKSDVSIAGLPLKLRLDRIDRLIDNSLLVVDYKSGEPNPGSWDLPRPDDVQLPLYANFAVDCDPGAVGGLVFAKVRTGNAAFVGRVRDARATLLGKVSGNSNLVKKPLTSEQLSAWKTCIEQLALDFLSGSAVVAPRDYPETCERCGLQPICRIQEHQPQFGDDGGEEVGDA